MVKIKGKITKVGTSYGILIKKALVDAEVLPVGAQVEMEITTIGPQEYSGTQTRTSDQEYIFLPFIKEEAKA